MAQIIPDTKPKKKGKKTSLLDKLAHFDISEQQTAGNTLDLSEYVSKLHPVEQESGNELQNRKLVTKTLI